MSNDLVFLEPNCLNEIPFTTSKVIAENGQVDHHAVTRLIQKYGMDIKEFGILRFEIEEIKGRGQPEKIYKLNEEQATLLITYMKNTLPVRAFKKALVKQFYVMQKELYKREATRVKAKEARNALTDAINNLPDSPHKSMKYKHYTNLVYKIIFSKNAEQLRLQFGITKKEELRDYFNTDELKRVEALENQISVLISFGNDYSTIKQILEKKYLMVA